MGNTSSTTFLDAPKSASLIHPLLSTRIFAPYVKQYIIRLIFTLRKEKEKEIKRLKVKTLPPQKGVQYHLYIPMHDAVFVKVLKPQ